MQWIDKILKYKDNEAVKVHNRKNAYKHNKFNKEFTQYSWATSPGPTFSGGLSIILQVEFLQQYELNLRLNT